ncbi:MAG: hypothetical protein HY941_11290 [Gammaproteobacteria bacterium]|nr:hypothetical protein [Gammaproteobacteria bacterium]
MKIRCKYVGLIAGLALALSVSAATDYWPASAAEAKATRTAEAAVMLKADEASPVPAPVLFLAGGLLGLAAFLRWRQRMRS